VDMVFAAAHEVPADSKKEEDGIAGRVQFRVFHRDQNSSHRIA
jgi:hypothetical protein